MSSYNTEAQQKNIAWFLPRPKPDRYKGGMPLHAESWLFELAFEILGFGGHALNLFCGMSKLGVRVDINPEVKPDVLCDAHKISKSKQLKNSKFDIIFADPPYSNEESKELYGTGKINYGKWTSEATKLLKPNGLLIVYHKYVMPNPDPEQYETVKRVFIGGRIYHTPRVAIFFQKKQEQKHGID